MESNKSNLDKLNKYIFENTNINFLLGSGASVPFLGTLAKIENWLTDLEKDTLDNNKKNKLKAFFYKQYFETAIENNIFVIGKDTDKTLNNDLKKTKENYKYFFESIKKLIYLRKNQILNKQVNIFTTNIDILNEYVLDEIGFDFNDGFIGRFNPKYDLSSFRRSYHKESLFFNKTSEVPVFNIYKLHGSITWKYEKNDIFFDGSLELISNLRKLKNDLQLPKIDVKKEYKKVKEFIFQHYKNINDENINDENINKFIEEYDKLQIINPTKEKFQETVFRKVHYELLRLFANELEKENSTLIVIGFSFADEHIREIIIRALNYNPLLNVFVFDYNGKGVKAIEDEISKIKNNNLHIIKPDNNEKEYDFNTINNHFCNILNEIENKNDEKCNSNSIKSEKKDD